MPLLAAAAALLLAGCLAEGHRWGLPPTPTLDPSLTDRSLLTGQPCAAPCWYGLELGVSTKEEAIAVASALPFIDPSAVEKIRLSASPHPLEEMIHFPCREGVGNCAALEFVDDILVSIGLNPNYELTFGDVVTHLGPPEYVQVIPYHPEANRFCRLALIWKSRGVIVSFDTADPWPQRSERRVECKEVQGGTNVDADLPVHWIVYHLPSAPSLASVPETGRDFIWSGFAPP